jgi:hypothetical protein
MRHPAREGRVMNLDISSWACAFTDGSSGAVGLAPDRIPPSLVGQVALYRGVPAGRRMLPRSASCEP